MKVCINARGRVVESNQYKAFAVKDYSYNEHPQATGYIDKEKDAESNLGDHGVRKYDSDLGRFLCPDALWEKYISYTPYQYAGNDPINKVDWNGKEIRVYSERIPSSTLSKGSGSMFEGFIANLFSPRHTFMHIKTDKINAIYELGGTKDGTTKGNPIVKILKEGEEPTNGRIYSKEHTVVEPKEQTEFEFENKVIELFDKTTKNLPEYKGYPGPNSNGFIRYLIESNGGKLDEIPGAYGQSMVEPYKEIKDKEISK